mmetsp:Transcript_35283/g.81719  ORF Transcript_35283/g.81719 Transcript_35283/m.81719 type:complete len:609 (-) Transcript_35283:552-2378(-)
MASSHESYIPTLSRTNEWPLREIKTPHVNDVLCGRGGGTNTHHGNSQYRQIVKQNQYRYLSSNKRGKPIIARELVSMIYNMNPPGRFLEKNQNKNAYDDIGEERAILKMGQALREGAPEIRKQILADRSALTRDIAEAGKGSPRITPSPSWEGSQGVSIHHSPSSSEARHHGRLSNEIFIPDSNYSSGSSPRRGTYKIPLVDIGGNTSPASSLSAGSHCSRMQHPHNSPTNRVPRNWNVGPDPGSQHPQEGYCPSGPAQNYSMVHYGPPHTRYYSQPPEPPSRHVFSHSTLSGYTHFSNHSVHSNLYYSEEYDQPIPYHSHYIGPNPPPSVPQSDPASLNKTHSVHQYSQQPYYGEDLQRYSYIKQSDAPIYESDPSYKCATERHQLFHHLPSDGIDPNNEAALAAEAAWHEYAEEAPVFGQPPSTRAYFRPNVVENVTNSIKGFNIEDEEDPVARDFCPPNGNSHITRKPPLNLDSLEIPTDDEKEYEQKAVISACRLLLDASPDAPCFSSSRQPHFSPNFEDEETNGEATIKNFLSEGLDHQEDNNGEEEFSDSDDPFNSIVPAFSKEGRPKIQAIFGTRTSNESLQTSERSMMSTSNRSIMSTSG